MHKYLKTAQMSCLQVTNGGLLYLLPDVLVKIFTLVPLVYLWRSVILSGARVDMTMSQMLTYTYLSSLLADLLVVRTSASGWLSEGVVRRLYSRPFSMVGQLITQTVGGWLPMLALFAFPMALLAPALGISLLPASPLFFISLLLCVSLGFAIDLLFACLSAKLKNVSWLVSRIRTAVVSLLSGTFIPIQFLPFGLDHAMRYQPFACLGGAALSVFVGAGSAAEIIPLQLIWNLILWPVALFVFRKSQEGMVSYEA